MSLYSLRFVLLLTTICCICFDSVLSLDSPDDPFNADVSGDIMDEPLVFDVMAEDPQRVKVYWNPILGVSKVLELANRDVVHKKDNETGEMTETVGNLHVLIRERDGDDGKRRYIFLKKMLCHEVEWRVQWIDKEGKTHGPIPQRMGPSPVPWSPTIELNTDSMTYDKDRDMITVTVEHAVIDDGLDAVETLSSINAVAELQDCHAYFDRPVLPPKTLADGKTIEIPGIYARNRCSFWFRLQVLTWNSELGCRELFQTRDSRSTNTELACQLFDDIDCAAPWDTSELPCEMDCEAEVWTEAEYRYDVYGEPEAYVKIMWHPRIADRAIEGYLIRHAQIDSTYNNYPIKEFNITVQQLEPDVGEMDFDQYTKDPEGSYAVQACVLYEKKCTGKEPDWTLVPQRRIKFNDFISALPPPITTHPTHPPRPTYPPTPAVEINPPHLPGGHSVPEPSPEGENTVNVEERTYPEQSYPESAPNEELTNQIHPESEPSVSGVQREGQDEVPRNTLHRDSGSNLNSGVESNFPTFHISMLLCLAVLACYYS